MKNIKQIICQFSNLKCLSSLTRPASHKTLQVITFLILISVNNAFSQCGPIDDFDECTIDACNTDTYVISHTPVVTDDLNPCTYDECDPITGIISHTDINIDDGNPCTTDACDSTSGIVSHTDNTPTVTVTAGTIDCYGGTTCITISAAGGKPNYQGTGVQCGITAGTYLFTITDANNCPASGQVTITEPTKLEVTITSTQSGCSPNGTATANAFGGTPGYKYLWSPGSQTTNPATGLAPGAYCVLVTDDNECKTSTCVVVTSSVCNNLTPPVSMSGPAGICLDKNLVVEYCVTPNNPCATSYIWTYPLNVTLVSAANGPCAKFQFLPNGKFSSGQICVKAVTPCGNTTTFCKNVIAISDKPSKPVITGPTALCPGEIGIYSVPAILEGSYQWSVLGSALSFPAGENTTLNSVHVVGPGSNGSHVKIKVSNCKGQAEEIMAVYLRTNCRISSSFEFTESSNANEILSAFSVFPNPTSGKLKVNYFSEIKSEIKLNIVDLLGNVQKSDLFLSVEGENSKEIDLSTVAKGMYFVSVEMKGVNLKTLRVIVE